MVMREQCDDGNTISGDWEGRCPTVAFCIVLLFLSGPRLWEGDGCSATCVVEAGFVCVGGTEMVEDMCYPTCGDGVRVPREACDDGNTPLGYSAQVLCL